MSTVDSEKEIKYGWEDVKQKKTILKCDIKK